MRNAWTLARREYHRFFTSPIAYVVAFVTLLTLGIMFAITIIFYRQNAMGGGYGAPPAPDMGGIMGTFAFLMILMLPAITMRLVADENRMGTMELLLTAPVRDWELIVGKWLGGFLYMLTLIGTTLVYAFILNALESPGLDQQQLMTSYLGLTLVTASLLALGVGVSAMFNNQVAAFFVTLGVFVFLWWLVGFPANYVSAGSDLFSYLDMKTHFYDSMNQGVINLSDLAYFLSLIALGLFAGTTAVEVRRWG
ncbi:MAG: ABC transporter permease subunit [Chloroflexota bacterium]